ncbi:helix-turn-helix domain-containing protein [Erwinia mallotivora]|uniref:AraC-like ligand-binding domain-containing protein n=1 Tax=Erwinia mallotivora TaxID=69222 RepID=UPI0021C1AD30|nr:helix-turn-helix domain-containing protein [Erwinia mallotivora]
MQTFDTGAVAWADRSDYWRDAISQTFIPLECAFADGDRQGRITSGVWQDLRISEIACSAQNVLRRRRGADNHPDNLILLSVVSQGTTSVAQAGQQVSLTAGEFGLYDTRQPYQLHLEGESRQHVVQIPMEHLWQRLGKTDRLLACGFGSQHPLMPYLQMLLANLMALPDSLPQQYAAMLYDQLLSLVSSIISDQYRTTRNQNGSWHGLLFQIKIMINSHLAEQSLSASTVAANFNISPRYLARLFQKEGTSFGRYLLSQRLEKSAQALRSPLNSHTQVSEIAWRNGFSDMSWFSREFRSRFGCSPTDYRQGHQLTLAE